MKLKLLKITSWVTTLLAGIPKVLAQPQLNQTKIPPYLASAITTICIILFNVDPFVVGLTDFIVYYVLVWIMIFAFIYNVIAVMLIMKKNVSTVISCVIAILAAHGGLLNWVYNSLKAWVLPSYGWGLIFILIATVIFWVAGHIMHWIGRGRGIEEMITGVKAMKKAGKELEKRE